MLTWLLCTIVAGSTPVGHSLQGEWDVAWRRVLDRTGRPDPDGAIQQRFNPRVFTEMTLDERAAQFSPRTEREWAQTDLGARFFVHSLDELDLINAINVKASAGLGGTWKIGLAYDRLENRTTDSDLFRVDFSVEDLVAEGTFATITAYSRFEKDDLDVALALGYRREGLGEVRLRLFALDPFVNASFALIEGRNETRDQHVQQLDPALALAAEVLSAAQAGLRFELYGGAIVPHTTRFTFPAMPQDDREQRLSGWLAGALVEYQLSFLTAGASAMHFATKLDDLEETTTRYEAYVLADARDDLYVDGRVIHTLRPERTGATSRDDSEVFVSVRTTWMPWSVFGAELGWLHVTRRASGIPERPRSGSHNRLLTRLVLQLDALWVAFGVGWDLDGDGTGAFDGAPPLRATARNERGHATLRVKSAPAPSDRRWGHVHRAPLKAEFPITWRSTPPRDGRARPRGLLPPARRPLRHRPSSRCA